MYQTHSSSTLIISQGSSHSNSSKLHLNKLPIKPRLFLFHKQTENDTLFKKVQKTKFIDSALGKKYYGRKIILITKHTDLTHALNNRKLIKCIEFREYSLAISRLESRADNIIYCGRVLINRLQLKKIVLSLQGTITLRESPKLSQLQIFNMTRLYMRYTCKFLFLWNCNNSFRFDTKTFASLGRLERLTIVFQRVQNKKFCISEVSNLTQLIQNIINIPRLKILFVDLHNFEMNVDLLLPLLLLIGNSNLNDWYVRVAIPAEDAKNIHILKPVLTQINTLGIFTAPVGFHFSEMQIPRHHGNHRILSLFIQEFTKSNQQVNLYSILKHCDSLHALSIGLAAPLFIYQEEEDFTFSSKWARHLHTASLSVSRYPTLNSLLQRIQKESEALKSIGVLACGISSFHFPAIYEIIATNSLVSVQVSLLTSHFQQLTKLAAFSPNLSILHLQISHPSGQNYWDDDLPLSQLRNLKDLEISFGCPSGEGLWGDSLAHQILALQNLEVLSIRTRDQWSMLLLKLWVFVNNATLLPNLRCLNLETTITPVLTKKNRALTDLDIKYMLTGFTTKDALREIQQKIDYMINIHRKIEYINIQRFLALETGWIFYTRYER